MHVYIYIDICTYNMYIYIYILYTFTFKIYSESAVFCHTNVIGRGPMTRPQSVVLQGSWTWHKWELFLGLANSKFGKYPVYHQYIHIYQYIPVISLLWYHLLNQYWIYGQFWYHLGLVPNGHIPKGGDSPRTSKLVSCFRHGKEQVMIWAARNDILM